MSVSQPGPEDRTDVPPDVLDGNPADESGRTAVERQAEQRLATGGGALPSGPADIADDERRDR
jgi:hypothetical protein